MANNLLLMVSSLRLFRVMTKPSNSSQLDICHLSSLPILSNLLILYLPTHSNLPIHSHLCLDSRLELQGRAGSSTSPLIILHIIPKTCHRIINRQSSGSSTSPLIILHIIPKT